MKNLLAKNEAYFFFSLWLRVSSDESELQGSSSSTVVLSVAFSSGARLFSESCARILAGVMIGRLNSSLSVKMGFSSKKWKLTVKK